MRIIAAYLLLLGCSMPAATSLGQQEKEQKNSQNDIQKSSQRKKLSELIRYGLEHSPRLKKIRDEKKINDLKLSSTKYTYFPKLTSAASIGAGETNPQSSASGLESGDRSNIQSQFELKLSQPIYDNGISSINKSIAEYQSEILQLRTLKERDEYILEVAKQYIAWSLTESLHAINLDLQKIMDKQLQSAKQTYKQGLSTKSDFLRIETESQRYALQVEESLAAKEESQARLLTILGANSVADVGSSIEPGQIPELGMNLLKNNDQKSMDALVESMVANSSLEKEYKLNDLILEKNTERSRKKLYPEFTADAATGYSMREFVGKSSSKYYQNDSTYWNVALSLNYTLWDWGQIRRDVEVSATERSLATTKAELERTEYRQKIKSLIRQMVQDQKSLKLSREVLRMEEESFAVISEDFRNGRVSYTDLSNGLKSLLSAKIQYKTSDLNHIGRQFEIEYYKGSLYEVAMAH
ncbi:MAG: TolC family protein [Proteobacteria bacterium]|nr:TolC family protein [Pseudomonadota bacterium]